MDALDSLLAASFNLDTVYDLEDYEHITLMQINEMPKQKTYTVKNQINKIYIIHYSCETRKYFCFTFHFM